MTPTERRGILSVGAAALLWSTGGLGIKAVAEPPLVVAAYRSAVGAVTLVALLGAPRWRRTPGFLVAVASYAACLATFVVATRWTTAANAIFLQYSGVVWVLVLSPLVLGEPLGARDAVAVAVAFAGMALFFAGRLEAHGRAGDVVALLSGLFYAALLLSLRREGEAGAPAAATWGNVLLALVLLPAVLGAPAPAPRSAAILLFLGAVQLAGGYVFFLRGLRAVTATRAALVGMIEPVANPLWVFLALGERPAGRALAGAAVVLGAIAWRTLAGGRPPATPLPAPD